MATDENEIDLPEPGVTKGHRQGGLTKGYQIQVRGEVPKDLRQRISALHAWAIMERRGEASDTGCPDGMAGDDTLAEVTTGGPGPKARKAQRGVNAQPLLPDQKGTCTE